MLARYRIHDAVTELDPGYDGSLADLAARYGWFDQAHFTREFTDLVGVPPGATGIRTGTSDYVTLTLPERYTRGCLLEVRVDPPRE